MKERLKDRKRSILSQTVFSVMILLTGLLWTGLSGWLLQIRTFELYRNLFLSVIMSFVIIFSYCMAERKMALFSWNQGSMGRFTLFVCLSMVFLAAMGEVSYLAAPVSAAAIVITVFSGGFCGLVTYDALILQYGILNGLDLIQVMVLLLTGLLGFVLFMSLDRHFRYGGILFAYFAGDFVIYSLYFVMTEDGQALGDALLYTGIRLFSAFVGLLIILKLLGDWCIYKDDKKLAMLNDPDYPLLTQLKSINREAYFHAIHTAYLSEKIARRIGINYALAKAGGYYHKIGLIQDRDSIQNTILVGTSHKFPASLIRILKEYGIRNMNSVSKEAAVVQLSDAVVSSISYLFLKDGNAVLNYEKIVDVIIRKKLDSGDFDHCELTMEELCQIKKGFAEEKLYYDFLR